MTQTVNELIGSIVQILLFTLIPFIWWLITARKKEKFFSWIGLKKPVGDKKKILLFMLGAFVICEVVGTISACKISFAKDNIGADSSANRYANSHY